MRFHWFVSLECWVASLFLLQYALWVEAADVAAFAAGGGVDGGVDRGWGLPESMASSTARLSSSGVVDVDADATEGLHHLVVAGALDEDRGGRVGAARVGFTSVPR